MVWSYHDKDFSRNFYFKKFAYHNNTTGIVIKYENMSYRTAVHYAHVVLSLHSKASKYARDLFDPLDVSFFL